MQSVLRFLRVASPAPVVLFTTLLMTGVANAELIWDGDASLGNGIFSKTGTGNCEGPSTLTAVSDPTHGLVWQYYKPTDSNRCENHGFIVDGSEHIAEEGETWYLGWWSKLSTDANNNANFQWKSYGDHIQNFPLVLKMINGEMTLLQRQPGPVESFPWRREVEANTWNHYVLGIHVSSELEGGWVEVYFNGEQQTFTDGSMRFHGRTLDSGYHNCPKWGVYGGSGQEMYNWIAGLKVGTTYDDVKMDGASGGVGGTGGSDGTGGVGGAGAVGGSSAAGGAGGTIGAGGTGVVGGTGGAGGSLGGSTGAGAVGGTQSGVGGVGATSAGGTQASGGESGDVGGARRGDDVTGNGCTCRAVGGAPISSLGAWAVLGTVLVAARRRRCQAC